MLSTKGYVKQCVNLGCDEHFWLLLKFSFSSYFQISVYAVPDKIDQAGYALETAVKLLDFYDDYFNIPYPLPKQGLSESHCCVISLLHTWASEIIWVLLIVIADLAAIPEFQSGAMENWGLTTYRESGLLFDPEKSSPSDKLGITKVIAHELAHQVSAPSKIMPVVLVVTNSVSMLF